MLLLLSCAPDEAAIQFLQGDGKKWTDDIEVRRMYIDLLHGAGKSSDLQEFCKVHIEKGVDDWKLVKGWIDGCLGIPSSDASRPYQVSSLSMLI